LSIAKSTPFRVGIELDLESVVTVSANIFSSTEFWSAIAGAIVGGLVALCGQLVAFHEAKRQRIADERQRHRALGNSLLFKMIRIHSNIHAISKHFESCLNDASRAGFKGEPWQIILPLANPPEFIRFSPDEMGMLISQGCDEVFNAVMEIDAIHNSLIAAIKAFNKERILLGERIAGTSEVENAEGNVVSGIMTKEQFQVLRPIMIGVNSLFNAIRSDVQRDAAQSQVTLNKLHSLLRNKLGLPYKLAFKTQPFHGEMASS